MPGRPMIDKVIAQFIVSGLTRFEMDYSFEAWSSVHHEFR